jgi:hypothetical protein
MGNTEMKLKILAFIAIAAISVIGPANAAFYNGSDILADGEESCVVSDYALSKTSV